MSSAKKDVSLQVKTTGAAGPSVQLSSAASPAGSAATPHPLDSLSPAEILAAVALVRQSRKVSERARFVAVTLQEPAKQIVLDFKPAPGNAFEPRSLRACSRQCRRTRYEAVVSLTRGQIKGWKPLDGAQPPITLDEFFECEECLKKDPQFQAALALRGVTDMSLIMVDPWSAGNYGGEDDNQGLRLARALTWIRSEPGDNGYARPLEGLTAVVDLNRMALHRLEDEAVFGGSGGSGGSGGVIPLPPESSNYSPRYIKNYRNDVKPLEIQQPMGPSFQVEGSRIAWQKWKFRIGFTPREGLVLYQVTYNDDGRERPVLYRASMCDMVVPYGDPHPNHFRKNAFDCGEYGIGLLANSLALGCDCLGLIHYFDAHVCNSKGEVVTIKNAICLHEEDAGILWKHMDWRTNETEVRRNRRLVISFIATVGNYEYGFYWYFQQDGLIQFEIKLTGIMHTGALPPGENRPYGRLVAPQLYAPIHQHIFNVRLDMMIDGMANSVYSCQNQPEPPGPDNPHGNACALKATLLRTEGQAHQLVDPLASRTWKIVNPGRRNRLGEPVGYRLIPGDNAQCFLDDTATVVRRAGFMKRHFWVTRYDPAQKYATGDYPNQNAGDTGLPAYVRQDRPIENTNAVVWYTMVANHAPRPEDWPVMPVTHIGFMLKPDGFFERNPALDVPGSAKGHCCAEG